jgi:hypothetical protein
MAIGDILNPKRVRTQANERLDTGDADALSSVAREHLDAYSRAVEAAPRAVGSSTPTGLILQGFGLTLNPTGPTDAKVRVQSALGVAFDANGRMLIKESGVQVDLTLPSGNSQVYVYYVESSSDSTVRRVISVSSPFTESGASIPTKFKSDVAFFTRAGDQTSIVASDVVNGATTALCFLGVANNSGGTITMTGYNASTAPNGAFATNRVTSVATPATLPTTNTMNGSVATMQDLTVAALYMIGQALWKGSRNFTPAAGNNFGAFAVPTAGLDGLFNALAEATVTPITRWRDWNGNNRALTDHNGYRMGQVTEYDQNWASGGTKIFSCSPMSASTAMTTTGTNGPSVGVGGVTYNGTGVVAWAIALYPLLPGMTITQLQVAYISTVTTWLAQVWSEDAASGGSSAGLKIAEILTPVSSGGVKTFTTITPVTGTSGTDIPWTIPSQGALSANVNSTAGSISLQWCNIIATAIVDPEGWSWTTINANTTAGFGRRTYSNPNALINQRSVTLAGKGGTVSAGTATLTTEAFECFISADVAYVQEWILATGTISDASNVRLFAIGIENINDGFNSRFVYFYNQNTTTNWQLRVVGASTTDTDTGVAIAANTAYRMRLEILGANVSTAGVGNFRIRAFINGNKVVDIITPVTAIPVAAIRPYMQVGTTGATGGPYNYSVGRLRRAWNHLLNGDNL